MTYRPPAPPPPPTDEELARLGLERRKPSAPYRDYEPTLRQASRHLAGALFEAALPYALGLLAAATIFWLLAAMETEQEEWEEFKAHHACQVVARVKGDVFTTVGTGPKGQVVVGTGSTPDKTGWRCDDGITYYR